MLLFLEYCFNFEDDSSFIEGLQFTLISGQNPLCIKSLDWSAEGYQMWIVNSKTRSQKVADPEFMPFPETFEKEENKTSNPLANKALVLQFVKR